MNVSHNLIRAVIAIVFAVALVVGFFLDKVSSDIFFTFVGSAITYYFASPASDDNDDDDSTAAKNGSNTPKPRKPRLTNAAVAATQVRHLVTRALSK